MSITSQQYANLTQHAYGKNTMAKKGRCGILSTKRSHWRA